MIIGKPTLQTLPPYYTYYVNLALETNLISAFNNCTTATLTLINSINLEQENYAYAPNKWTVKQVINHIIDSERVLAYRAFCFSRKDNTKLPSFDENKYAINANTNTRNITELLTEYLAVRAATVSLFEYLNNDMLNFEGEANGQIVTARGIGWFIVGHNTHHCNIIKERYLST